jgi:hypothetical protein
MLAGPVESFRQVINNDLDAGQWTPRELRHTVRAVLFVEHQLIRYGSA